MWVKTGSGVAAGLLLSWAGLGWAGLGQTEGLFLNLKLDQDEAWGPAAAAAADQQK